MSSLFKMPKYEPPPAINTANEALDRREERADASEKRELRKISSRRRAKRQAGRLLLSQDRAIPQLGVGDTLTGQSMVRNPYDDERMT